MKKHNNKGLSVVELVIVVAIISIVVTVISVSLFRFIQRSKKEADISNASTIASAIQTALNETEIKNECMPYMASGMMIWAPPGQPFTTIPGIAGPGSSSLLVTTVNQYLGGKSPEIKYTKNNCVSWSVVIDSNGIIVAPGDATGVPIGSDHMFPHPTGDYIITN